ncbi:CbiQ family ECF transporter T component [Anaeromyxobacter soli]|uniref:CbiQ family ECF transporter T component n=4 Tax=Anaeromyxobacter TaxID=161492 RepID=UPI001FAF358C|nr:CbiQ family ECF transporter T component [Anaeromyxobacter sp. SG29]
MSRDPRLRLALGLAALALVAAVPHPGPALAVAAVALASVGARGGRLGRLVLAPVLLGAVTASAAALAPRAAPDATARGLLVAARVLAGGAVGAWLCATLPLPALLCALAWARCPRPLVELLALAARQAASLSAAAASVRDAQRARLGYAGLGRAIDSAGQLAGAVTSRAMDRAAALADTVAVRGEPPVDALPPLAAGAAGGAALVSAIAIALVACALFGGGRPW